MAMTLGTRTRRTKVPWLLKCLPASPLWTFPSGMERPVIQDQKESLGFVNSCILTYYSIPVELSINKMFLFVNIGLAAFQTVGEREESRAGEGENSTYEETHIDLP